MAGMSDPRDRKTPGAWKRSLDRRKFIQSMGVLSLAAWAPKAVFSAGRPEALPPQETTPPVVPLFGALFNPYHSPEDWNLLGRRGAEGMPLLGSYSSSAAGSVATQMIWARMTGLHFFLAAYCLCRSAQSGGLDALFEVAARDGYKVGLYIDLQDDAGRPQQHSPEARLAAALDEVSTRYLSHPAYFRTALERPILAVAGLDDGGMIDEALAARAAGQALGPVLRLPGAWRSSPDSQSDPELARAVQSGRLYLGFSARHEAGDANRVIPCHSQQAAAVLAPMVRDETGGVRLPVVAKRSQKPSYVILDSFNNWGVSVPLEPGTISQTRYMQDAAQWAGRYMA